MKILGLLFILVGLFLCFTILFFHAGVIVIGLGALLIIAGWRSKSGRIAKVCEIVLGSMIGIAVVWAGLAFISLVVTARSQPQLTPAVNRQLAPPAHSSQTSQRASHHTAKH